MNQKKNHIVQDLVWLSARRNIKIAASLIIVVLTTIWGCQNQNQHSLHSWMEDSGRIKSLSTIAQIGDLAAEIGQDRVDAWTLIQGTLDPHSYELVKGDGEKLERADVIFYNGLGLEHGASLSSWLHSTSKATSVGDRILQKSPEKILYKGQSVDPHIWMDISLWVNAVDMIVERFSAVDPEGASYYRERGRLLRERMETAHREIIDQLHSVPKERRYLVTSHDAFHYFTHSYLAEEGEPDWANRFAAPEGLAPDGQLSPVDIQRIIDYVKLHQVSVLFPESNVSRDSIRKIANAGGELGLPIVICTEKLYGDAMDGDIHYLEMMRRNSQTIAKHLKGP